MIRTAMILSGLFLGSVAHAQSVRLNNYLHPESETNRTFNDIYLAGAIDALTAYNMAAPSKLFCKADGIVSHEEATRLLKEWATTQTKVRDDTLIVIPLLLLLKKAYPCGT